MRYIKDDTLRKVSGGKISKVNNQFSVTQKCPIGCFTPKSIQCLDICDNCKFGKRTYENSEIVTCSKIQTF